MHIPHIQKFHTFSHTLHFLEHHIFAAIVSIGAALCLLYLLNTPTVRAPGVSANSSELKRALTLLDDPRYEHEFERRSAYITHHLDTLRKDTEAQRAYLISYRYGSSHSGGLLGLELSRSFQVSQGESVEHHIREYRDLSRANWLRVNRDGFLAGGMLPGPFPRSYGVELYDGQGRVIGYLGINFLPEDASYHGKEVQVLRSAVDTMKKGLLGTFEHVTQ